MMGGLVAELPQGIVTFLFSDVDRSTELVKRLQERYGQALAEHRALMRAAFTAHGGAEVDTQGDSFFVAFARPRDGVMAAIAAQRALADHRWPDDARLAVRMGLHTGEAHRAEHGYVGVAVHRAARICTIAHGGQVLLARSTAGMIDDEELPGVSLRDLGEQRLKDLDRPERIWQLVIEGLPTTFPPLRTIDQQMPLLGTVTLVMAEGRRLMRLARELSPDHFGALLNEYQRLLQTVFEEMGGREVDVHADTAVSAFPSAKQAALVAVAAQRAVSTHEWPHGLRPDISVGLHSGEAGIGWVGPAVLLCEEICDAAEAGEIFMSQATAGLLEDENLGELRTRDLGVRQTRRTNASVHVHQLIVPAAKPTD